MLVICFHGAAASALSFCQLAKQLKNLGHSVIAYDLYGHGDTLSKEGENELNLDINLLIDQAE